MRKKLLLKLEQWIGQFTWISVEECEPPTNEFVLVRVVWIFDNLIPVNDVIIAINDGRYWVADGDPYGLDYEEAHKVKITHWKPIPSFEKR